MKTTQLTASGLHCKSCTAVIQDILEEKGAKNISISFDGKKGIAKITCDYDKNKSDLSDAIEQEGYAVQ